MMRVGSLAVLVMLGLTACEGSNVGMASPGQDIAGKQFAPPPPGMGAVYFFNPVAASPVLNVTANGQEIGALGTQTWMRTELAAGPYTLRCRGGGSSNAMNMNIAAGTIRYVDVQMLPGQYVCTIRETDPGSGQSAVMSGSRAAQY
jgi:hypothetical protein